MKNPKGPTQVSIHLWDDGESSCSHQDKCSQRFCEFACGISRNNFKAINGFGYECSRLLSPKAADEEPDSEVLITIWSDGVKRCNLAGYRGCDNHCRDCPWHDISVSSQRDLAKVVSTKTHFCKFVTPDEPENS